MQRTQRPLTDGRGTFVPKRFKRPKQTLLFKVLRKKQAIALVPKDRRVAINRVLASAPLAQEK